MLQATLISLCMCKMWAISSLVIAKLRIQASVYLQALPSKPSGKVRLFIFFNLWNVLNIWQIVHYNNFLFYPYSPARFPFFILLKQNLVFLFLNFHSEYFLSHNWSGISCLYILHLVTSGLSCRVHYIK